MGSNPRNYMDYGCGDRSFLAKVRMRRLSLRPTGYSPALPAMYSAAAAAVHGLWRYISAGPLSLTFFHICKSNAAMQYTIMHI